MFTVLSIIYNNLNDGKAKIIKKIAGLIVQINSKVDPCVAYLYGKGFIFLLK